MEFPDLGEHCSEKTCKRLGEFKAHSHVPSIVYVSRFGWNFNNNNNFVDNTDFLPMRCDACQEIFCKDHITYANHKCTSSYKKVSDI